jgi:hypothetical protein
MRFPRHRALGVALLLLTFPAQAEPIPGDKLAADHRACIAACTQQGVAVARCTQYCDCTFEEIGRQFTLEDYNAALVAAQQKTQPSQDFKERMVRITQGCMAEMK